MQVNLDYSSLKCEETRQELSDLIVTKLSTGKNCLLEKPPKSQEETQTKVPDLTDHRFLPALNPLFDPKEHSVSLTTVEENSKEQPKILTTVETFGIQRQPQIGIQLNPLRSRPDQERERENLTAVQKRETGKLI
jgi:hypothetical protein